MFRLLCRRLTVPGEVAGDDNSLVNQQVLYFSGFFPKKTK